MDVSRITAIAVGILGVPGFDFGFVYILSLKKTLALKNEKKIG